MENYRPCDDEHHCMIGNIRQPESEDDNEDDNEDNKIHTLYFEDPRFVQEEETCQLDIEQKLDDLVSSGESRLAIVGGSLTEATCYSARLCTDYGSRNTSQRMVIIEIYIILYFTSALASVTCQICGDCLSAKYSKGSVGCLMVHWQR